jgi:TolB-like protein
VAVLAFANLTGDPANDIWSDGIAEEIITTLVALQRNQGPARTSSFAYRGRNLDPARSAANIGVSTIPRAASGWAAIACASPRS